MSVFLHQNLKDFYASGINNLPNKQDYAIDNQGKYCLEYINEFRRKNFVSFPSLNATGLSKQPNASTECGKSRGFEK